MFSLTRCPVEFRVGSNGLSDHLEVLNQSVAAWNTWRIANPDTKPDLSGAQLLRAQLQGANFSRVNLVQTGLQQADLSSADLLDNCRVYGASVWDLQGTAARQVNLIISPDSERALVVDDLKIAQFIRLFLTHREIREVIETIGRKVVLILGRFTPDRK
jgi:Pentapeptide repeats (8 copies)